MKEFFEWIYELTTAQAWILFGLICIVLSIIPYLNIIFRIFIIFFRNEPSEIIDFSWRLAPDHLLIKKGEVSYYIRSNESQYILEGGKIILNWHVKGAYRIDIIGLGKKLKGNNAYVIARKDNCNYKLVAYTVTGKLERFLIIDPSLIKNLGTFNLSGEEQFKQRQFKDLVFKYPESQYIGQAFSKQSITKSNEIGQTMKKFLVGKRISDSLLKPKTNAHFGFSKLASLERIKLNKRLNHQSIVKIFGFNPGKYNQEIIKQNKL